MNLQTVALKSFGLGLNIIGLLLPSVALKIAFHIFAKPRAGRIKSFQKKFLEGFRSETIIVDGYEITTYTKGVGAVKILLVHGWESNSWRWRKLIRFLGTDRYTFIALDAPGHGQSQPDKFDLKLYVKAIQAVYKVCRPHAIIGHSVGGLAVLMHEAYYETDKGLRLISMCAPHSLNSIFERYFHVIGLSKHVTRKQDHIFNEKYGHGLEYFDVAHFGRKIEKDGVLIHDINDTTNTIEESRIIKKHWEKGLLIETEYSDHSLQHDNIYLLIRQLIDG